MQRDTVQAGCFYPASEDECLMAVKKCLPRKDSPKQNEETIVAGIVPHAGWVFSGPTAGKVYQKIANQRQPETFVLFGAVHVHGVSQAAIWPKGDWNTPLGPIMVDEALAEKILNAAPNLIQNKPIAHLSEHSLEVQIPFICYLFPQARIVPIMVSPFPEAYKIGECVAKVSDPNSVVAIGSTDLTHYGSRYDFTPAGTGAKGLQWVKEQNDKRLVELMLQLKAEQVVDEACENQNACGPGAIAATLGYARALGKKKGTLLEYTTSYDVHPERRIDSFVGYAGVVF